jgi:hypothetical protein
MTRLPTKTTSAWAGIVIASLVCLSGTASGGSNQGHKLAIHVKSHPTSCSAGYPSFNHCGEIEFTYAGTGDIDVFPVFFELTEYLVVEFGLEWPAGWGTASWVRCDGDISVGDIVHPGDGTAVDWAACQTTWSAAPGFAWLTAYGSGVIRAVPNPATGDYGAVDCDPDDPVYDYPFGEPYSAGVGGETGDDPCRPKGGSESSWGTIKSMFR